MGESLFVRLEQAAERCESILCIEPSEASALKDDLPDLIHNVSVGKRVASKVDLIDDFISREVLIHPGSLEKRDSSESRPVWIHPHCHQRALFSSTATQDILRHAGYDARVLDLGCCGMAGSFGYHQYDVSRRVGELKFLPAVQAAQHDDVLMVATGTSCREQASDFVAARLVHWTSLVRGTNLSRTN
jgi:Fe-S oxidoreductase